MNIFKHPTFDKIDLAISGWMYKNGRFYLRISLAVIFIWFGALKLFGLSPAEDLIAKTITWMPSDIFIPILGWWEIIIGICLLFKPLLRFAIFLLFMQMSGTILPLILLPEVCYTQFPFGLTLEGQYIIKNLIIISAALVIGGGVRDQSIETNEIKK